MQNIITSFEPLSPTPVDSETDSAYFLQQPELLSQALESCLITEATEIHLLPRFFKLSLQIISRFRTWIESVAFPNLSASQIVKLHSDSLQFRNDLLALRSATIQAVDLMQMSDQYRTLIGEAFEIALSENAATNTNFSSRAKSHLTDHFQSILKYIFDIPRLYRRTNRDLTHQPSKYVLQVRSELETITNLTSASTDPALTHFLHSFILQLIESHSITVTNLLDSARKTEESLQKLKMVREKKQQFAGSRKGLSDEDKIRMQVLIDLQCLSEMCSEMGLDFDKLKEFVKIRDMLAGEIGGKVE